MADKKAQVIIIKKKKVSGHGGHHGGAWKVAYADFVTAMMAFFLVMWLMGSDEETKAAISHYFNHPNTPYVMGRDPASNMVRPLGDNVAQGDNIMNGMEGKTPDDLVDRAVQPYNRQLAKNEELSDTARKLIEGEVYGVEADIEHLKFSIPAHLLFKEGSAEFTQGSREYLDKLGNFFHSYKGYVTIEGHTDDDPDTLGKYSNAFEFTMARSVAVMNYLIDKNYLPEERLKPVGSGGNRMLASNATPSGRRKNRRIEFTLSLSKPE
jgi:chemotaxis protein MotB